MSTWEKPVAINHDILQFGEKLKDVLFDMRKFKSENNLSMRAKMDKLQIKTEPKFLEWVKQSKKDMQACSSAKEIVIEI